MGITGNLSDISKSAIITMREKMAEVQEAVRKHISNTSNPHKVTKEQIGLGNVDNTSDAEKPISEAQQQALDGKVDKVEGMGLSSNDYTDEEKAKLAGIDLEEIVSANTVIKDITIPANDWAEQEDQQQVEENGGFSYYVNVSVEEATSEQFPALALHNSSYNTAKQAELCPTVQALDGVIRLWSKRIPAANITATIALLANEGLEGGGGEAYELPIATAQTLGGVKIGDGIDVTGDGTISSSGKLSFSDLATDEETEEMLDDVFTI